MITIITIIIGAIVVWISLLIGFYLGATRDRNE